MQIIMIMLIIAEGQGGKPVSRFVKLALRRTMHNWPMELDNMELCMCVWMGGLSVYCCGNLDDHPQFSFVPVSGSQRF